MAQQGSVGTTGGVLAREADAERIVHGHVMWAMGAGLIPLPLFDIAAVTAVQMDMLKQLARVYSVDYSTAAGKTFAGALTGGTFAHVSAALLKFIPGSTQFWVGSLCRRCPAHPPMRWGQSSGSISHRGEASQASTWMKRGASTKMSSRTARR